MDGVDEAMQCWGTQKTNGGTRLTVKLPRRDAA